MSDKDKGLREKVVRVFLREKSIPLEDWLRSVGGETVLDTLPQTGGLSSVQTEVGERLLQETIKRMLESLSFQERKVLELRYGLNGGEPELLEQIGVRLGRTRAGIQQIEKGALSRLRHPSRSRFLIDFLKI